MITYNIHREFSFWHHKRQNVHALIERKWRKQIENLIILKKFLVSVQLKKSKNYFCCCLNFFTPFIQIKWLYNICSTTCLAAPFKEALNQKGVFLTFYTMWCAGGWFPSFKCDEYFMTTGNCQAVWRLDGWGWRKKKVSYSRRKHVASIFYSIHGSSSASPEYVYVCATQKRGNFYGLVMATLPQLRRRGRVSI